MIKENILKVESFSSFIIIINDEKSHFRQISILVGMIV